MVPWITEGLLYYKCYQSLSLSLLKEGEKDEKDGVEELDNSLCSITCEMTHMRGMWFL